MPAIILAAKACHGHQLNSFENQLRCQFEGLDAKIGMDRISPGNWVQVNVSGQDQSVVVNYLRDEVGFSFTDVSQIKRYATMKGYVSNLLKSQISLSIDIGQSESGGITAHVPLGVLQAQLADGRKLALNKIVELYGFHDDLPLNVMVSEVDTVRAHVEADLSDRQLAVYTDWVDSLLDRLLVLGASVSEVGSAVKACGLTRDVVDIVSLGPFEHAMVCKLGTDAKGLIPRIGRRLGKAGLSVFSPRKIRAFLGE